MSLKKGYQLTPFGTFLDVAVCSKVFGGVFSVVFAWEKSMLQDGCFLQCVALIAGTILWVMLMEWKALIEQDKQDLEKIAVQTVDKEREKPKKQRSAEEKIGRHKYHEVLTKKVFAQNERLLGELRCFLGFSRSLSEF